MQPRGQTVDLVETNGIGRCHRGKQAKGDDFATEPGRLQADEHPPGVLGTAQVGGTGDHGKEAEQQGKEAMEGA